MSDEFKAVKRADQLRPGDRFIFTQELGGEDEVVTVASLDVYFGTAEVGTEEVDFTISMLTSQMVQLVPDEESTDEEGDVKAQRTYGDLYS